jgi:hypothetical protein
MNIWTLLRGLVPTENENTFSSPWQLVAPKKAVKWHGFTASNIMCTFIDRNK